jgi:hypothetical protein
VNDSRLRIGGLASVLWLFAAGTLLFLKSPELSAMSPNAWGDFFAGAFAPLAFLWLVLGYLQQGEELRLSTAALRLQAEELRNSVEQQRALVEVTRQQVESDRATLAEERQSRDEEIRPALRLEYDNGSFRDDGHTTYVLAILNVGGIASDLTGDVVHRDGRLQRVYTFPVLDRGARYGFSVEVSSPDQIDGCKLSVKYRDRLGRGLNLDFGLSRSSVEPNARLVLSQIVP